MNNKYFFYINNLFTIAMCVAMLGTSYKFYTFTGSDKELLDLQLVWVFIMALIYFFDKFFPPSIMFQRIYLSYYCLSVGIIGFIWGGQAMSSIFAVVSLASSFKFVYWLLVIVSLIIGFIVDKNKMRSN